MTRLVVFGLRHVRQGIDEYVLENLRRLKPHADYLAVLKPAGWRPRGQRGSDLAGIVDAIWDGTDLGSEPAVFRHIRTYLDADGAAHEFDEVTWLDDSCFGPIDAARGIPSCVDADADGHVLVPADRAPGWESSELPFLTLRASTLATPEFGSALDADRCGFTEFIARLETAGLNITPVHPWLGEHEVFFARDSILRLRNEGLNLLPTSVFTRDPLVNDRWGIVPRESYDWMLEAGYPVDAIWDYLLMAVPPRTWYTNLSMAEILPERALTNRPSPLTTAVLVHIYYTDMAQELLDLAATLPGEVRVVATTNTAEKQQELQAVIGNDDRFASVEVRVVTSNRGRDISAFLIDCADVLRDESVDMIVKLHSKRSVQDPGSVSGWFRRHLFENLFASEGYARNVYELFEREPLLGMVFPPTIHMGLPTMGRAWSLNLAPAHALRQRLGVRNPFDANTPLSPYGSMFIARRAALEPLLQANFEISEFPDAPEYRDGSLAHVLERLVSYVAISQGFYVKTVESARIAAISEPFLEYKTQAVGEYLQAHTIDQVATLRGRGETWPLWQAVRRVFWTRLEDRVPGSGKWLSRGFQAMGKAKSVAVRVIKR